MLKNPATKYRPFPPVHLPDRQWPNRVLTRAPRWCSVDLRDGNQALAVPMNVSQKLELFQTLAKCGFKEIEVGFPSASNTEFTFNRRLIEENRAPDDVWLQVLVQAREELIERTIQSLVGARKAIIHLYNSTSPAQRRVVFRMSKEQIVQVAVRGAQMIKDRLPLLKGTEVMLQYSPESFSATEVEFAKEVSEAVMDVWQPTPERKMILNLPDTVEVAMPNVYADQIEWMCRNIRNRDSLIISLHTHNDRSTGVAATELGLLAGADRVEGTLFGNGERTGNLDIVTVALNLYMHGIDPELDFSNLNAIVEVYERCTGMTVPPRHPYAGELVFTAFSGSHQDAIKKGLAEWEQGRDYWDVPYLTIDPRDINREYREVIRVNSQSGKGGMAYLLESEYGVEMPRRLQIEFMQVVQRFMDVQGKELVGADIWNIFRSEYGLDVDHGLKQRVLEKQEEGAAHSVVVRGELAWQGRNLHLEGRGNGPIDAFTQAMAKATGHAVRVLDYHQHAIGAGADAQSIAYLELRVDEARTVFGVGIDADTTAAALKAIASGLSRAAAAVQQSAQSLPQAA